MKVRRRIIALGAFALLVPVCVFAQQKDKVWRIGFLATRRPISLDTDVFGAFPRGMRELGYIEGKNFVIEWRFGEGRYERLAGLAADLVKSNVDIIVTAGTPATGPAQRATVSIPIIMANSTDPVGSGFVMSLARPGGNITGLSNIAVDIVPKQLEMLRAMLPKIAQVGVLLNPTNSGHAAIVKSVQSAARKVNVTIV